MKDKIFDVEKFVQTRELDLDDGINEKDYIKDIVEKIFNVLRLNMGLKYSQNPKIQNIKLNFEEDENNLKQIIAFYGANEIRWSQQGFINDLLIIMNKLKDDKKPINFAQFEKIVKIIMAHEIGHLLDDEYHNFCKYRHEISKKLLMEDSVESCQYFIIDFKQKQILNQNRAWEIAESRLKLCDIELFNQVKEISLLSYNVDWELFFEMEFFLIIKYLKNELSLESRQIIQEKYLKQEKKVSKEKKSFLNFFNNKKIELFD